jgi:hypothetical protein
LEDACQANRRGSLQKDADFDAPCEADLGDRRSRRAAPLRRTVDQAEWARLPRRWKYEQADPDIGMIDERSGIDPPKAVDRLCGCSLDGSKYGTNGEAER